MKFPWVPGLLALVLLSLPAQAANPQATLKLQEYVLGMDLFDEQASLQVVKDLIDQGADPHATYLTGANAFHLATESFAYLQASSRPTAPAAAEIVRYLAGLGVDTAASDFRRLSPLWTVLRYAGAAEPSRQMFEFLLTQKVDLDVSTARNLGLIHLLAGSRKQDELARLLDRGLDLRRETIEGMTFAHRAAVLPVLAGDRTPLQILMERLPEEDRRAFARKATLDGSTPLQMAAWYGNLATTRYLVEALGADVNQASASGDTALSIALENGKTELAAYLRERGAAEPVAATDIRCDGANAGDLGYERLVEIIQACDVRSINKLLPLLPVRYRSNYVTAYSTFAAQDASPDYPQVVFTGRDGKLLMAFNGHPSQLGYRNLELIQFRDETKSFELRVIQFPRRPSQPGARPVFSEANPIKCLGCHGTTPRPLWDTWTVWPGKFNGVQDEPYAGEQPYIERFARNRHRGRYRHLPELSFAPVQTAFGNFDAQVFQNTKVDQLVNSLMFQMIARELAAPDLRPFRYALLGAVSCSRTPVAEFLTPAAAAQFGLSLDYLREETRRNASAEMRGRLAVLEKLQGPPQGRYVVAEKRFGNRFAEGQAGRNFDVERVARIRYFAENLGLSTEHWFTPYNLGKASYTSISFAGLEDLLWSEVLSKDADAELWALYEPTWQKKKGAGLGVNLFYKTADEEPLCGLLKARSLSALGGA
jgi:ankyrin repeat protein